MGRASDDGSAADDDARAAGEMNRGRRSRKTWCASGDEERAEEGTRGTQTRGGARRRGTVGDHRSDAEGGADDGIAAREAIVEEAARTRDGGAAGCASARARVVGVRHSGPDDARRGAPCRRVRRHRYSFVPSVAAVVLVEQPWCRGLCLCSHDVVVVVLGAACAHNDELARAYVVGGHALSRVSRPLVPRSRRRRVADEAPQPRSGRLQPPRTPRQNKEDSTATGDGNDVPPRARTTTRTRYSRANPSRRTFPANPRRTIATGAPTHSRRRWSSSAPRTSRTSARPFRRDGHGHAQARTAELHASRIRAQGRRRRAPRLQRARGHDIAGGLGAEHFDAVAEHLKATLEELDLAVDVVREAVSTVAPVGDV